MDSGVPLQPRWARTGGNSWRREDNMHDYDPSSHHIPMRDIITAWAVAIAVYAILLVLPDFARTDNANSAEVSTKTAIEQTIPRDTDFFADSRQSR